MTITPELKEAVERAGEEPVRVEDPETAIAYVIVREDIYRDMRETWEEVAIVRDMHVRMGTAQAIDHPDRSLCEFGEFHPDR